MANDVKKTDVFKSEVEAGEAWSLSGAVLNFGDNNGDVLATNMNITYKRSVTKMKPLNSNKSITIVGDAVGSISLSALLGPSKDIKAFLDTFSSICEKASHVITVSPAVSQKCKGSTQMTNIQWVCTGCLLDGLVVNVQTIAGTDKMLTGSMSLTFDILETN